MREVEITTMCALFDNNQRVLFINREKSWTGCAFPGGHLEKGESIRECIIREMKEETGLDVRNPKFVGITHFFNTVNQCMHIIMNFVAKDYEGEVFERCDEGELLWVDINKLDEITYAEGMKRRLDLFMDDKNKEMYVEWNDVDGYTKIEKHIM